MKELQTIIKRWKISVSQLANICGMPRQTVHRHVNGEREISLESARKYSKGTRLPLYHFISGHKRGRKVSYKPVRM